MNRNELNVLFSSDDHYAQHLGAAMQSLLENNQDFTVIRIYIIDNQISDLSKEKLCDIVRRFSNSAVFWISFEKWKSQLQLNMTWSISISSYARLFVAEMIPDEIDRILYLDCDMIVCDSLQNLWNTDLQGCILGAVQDSIGDSTKNAVGLLLEEQYFNAGMLLIDLAKWRELDVGTKCVQFIAEKNGSVVHHDQGILNGVLKNQWFHLPLQDNLMTIHFIFNRRRVMDYFGEHSEFYSENEIMDAKEHPVIIHYTPSFTSRPWCKDCKHPRKALYWENLNKTPWKGAKPEKSQDKWYVKLINWRYRNIPF